MILPIIYGNYINFADFVRQGVVLDICITFRDRVEDLPDKALLTITLIVILAWSRNHFTR